MVTQGETKKEPQPILLFGLLIMTKAISSLSLLQCSYQNFGRRLAKDMKEKVVSRKDVEVNVIENHVSTSNVWLGGSILASTDDFFDACKIRKQYDEEGPRIFRQNAAFKVEL